MNNSSLLTPKSPQHTIIKEQCSKIIKKLKSYSNKKNIEGMATFGIKGENILGGPPLPTLRKMAQEIGKNHNLALQLWNSKIHEARILSSMIAEPQKTTQDQMENWVRDFDSWDICDQTCSNLFDKTNSAYQKASEWSQRNEEFVKRAGFVLMACLAVHDKSANNRKFIQFFRCIKRESTDEFYQKGSKLGT